MQGIISVMVLFYGLWLSTVIPIPIYREKESQNFEIAASLHSSQRQEFDCVLSGQDPNQHLSLNYAGKLMCGLGLALTATQKRASSLEGGEFIPIFREWV